VFGGDDGVEVGLGVLPRISSSDLCVGEGVCAEYFALALRRRSASPPHTIISLPVHTAVCQSLAVGTLLVAVAVQLSVLGLYLPPVLKESPWPLPPPQTIMSLPVQTALCRIRLRGALVVLAAVQVLVAGLYLPPVFTAVPSIPPHTIMAFPVQTAV
jgi:hypothetical protein